MRNGEVRTVNGAWSEEQCAWVSETITLTGDCYLEVTFSGKGRMVIKKAETENGPYPKALITKWGGPKFKIRIIGTTEARYIRIYLTSNPVSIEISNV